MFDFALGRPIRPHLEGDVGHTIVKVTALGVWYEQEQCRWTVVAGTDAR